MKFFIGIILIVLSTLVGYLFSIKYSERRIFFEDFNKVVIRLKNEINFMQRPVIDVLNSSLNNDSDVLVVYNSFLLNNYNYTSNLKYLSFNEKNFVFDFLSTIGTGDVLSQNKIIDVAIEQSNSFLKQSIDDEKKYKTLFIKLGLLAGITLFILFI